MANVLLAEMIFQRVSAVIREQDGTFKGTSFLVAPRLPFRRTQG